MPRLPFALLLAPAAAAAASPLSPLDAFIEFESATRPGYRAEVRPGPASEQPEPGRKQGWSGAIGPFTYRSRRFSELGPRERAELLADPSLPRFLLSAAAQPSGRAPLFVISAAEALDPAELRIAP